MMTVLDLIKHYQHSIEKYPDDEQRLLRCISKLHQLAVTVRHLEETGVGRTVNALRKEPGTVGEAARALVKQWKYMVAAEEKSDPEDHIPDTSNYNGHGSGEDSDNTKNRSRKERYHEYIKKQNINQINGDENRSKRKYHSSEEEDCDTKRKRYSQSSDNEQYGNKSSDIKTESDSDNDDDNQESESETSEYSEVEDVKPKMKIKSPEKQSSTSSHSSHREQLKKLDTSYMKLKQEPSPKQLKDQATNSKHSSEKYSSKGKSSSSHKDKNYTDAGEYLENKHKLLEKSHSTSSSSKHGHSSEKHKHSTDKEDKHKHSSQKHESKSRKDLDKIDHRDSSSKRETSKEDKYKDSQKTSKDKHDKTKHRDRSSSSKEKSSHSHKNKVDKNQSSSSESKTKSNESDKHKDSSKEKGGSSFKEKETKQKSSSSSSHHKSSSSSSTSKNNTRIKEDEPKKKKETNGDSDDGIDCGSGASFAEALGMISPAKLKKKPLKDASSPLSTSSNNGNPTNLLAPTTKLAPLPPLEITALPEISPNYRPRPPPKLLPHFFDDDAMNAQISSKNQRTKVYSGNKTVGKVSTLYELCVQVLQEHIDSLEYTGGVPYDILKPVVDRATPEQLFMLEHYNPYLMDDTDHLWQNYCIKRFRNKQRDEMETWREMYIRCQEEQEHKLKSLTANIKMAQDAKNAPIKQTKMAYVDTVVKPPRNVARKQAIHGTARAAAASPAARVAALASAPGVLRAGGPRAPPAPPAAHAAHALGANRPKKAPLMQKALQFMRGRKR